MAIATEVMNQNETTESVSASGAESSLLSRAMKLEWLGQMVASLCWIVSVFSYGITSTGDWLQLAAACSWAVANIAALVAAEGD